MLAVVVGCALLSWFLVSSQAGKAMQAIGRNPVRAAAMGYSVSSYRVALTMYDRRNNLTEQVAQDVRTCLGDVVFETVIPRNVRLSEAPSHGVPALIYDHRCSGSEAYMALARELLARLPNLKRAA